ncbi:MAG: anhydro-N-acetylmuramic acid kinase [Acidobacteriota bacterium]|nr:anhydro-N-acetylmuramic acid kinase [Acidobacteriota bacterium]
MSAKSMLVAGVMSGTSADGVDVALVRIAAGKMQPKITFIGHESYAYSAALRRAVLAAMNAESISTAELARLNWRLGLEYAEAVKATSMRHGGTIELVGCHGQTLYHQARQSAYAEKSFACTWQLGEMAMLAATMQAPVVSNFRPADMAVGGEGAPLVPLLDYVLFADTRHGRVLQNIGGIANLTGIPAGAGIDKVIAFDTGPGNMVMDAFAEILLDKKFDRNGETAARGTILEPVLQRALKDGYFARRPPKSAGREQYGRQFAENLLGQCLLISAKPEDALATATALTAESIVRGYKRFVYACMQGTPVDYIVSGGGAKNATLMKMLYERLLSFECSLKSSAEFGLPAEAKEAVAFALLAWQTWHKLPGNVLTATGARKPAILGQVTYAP